MPILKEILIAIIAIIATFSMLKGCASLAVDAWDRAYEGEREFIAEYRALSANVNEDY